MAKAAARGKQERGPRFVYVPRFGSHQCGGVLPRGGRRAEEPRGAARARGQGEPPPGSEPQAPAASSRARASSVRSGGPSAARAGGRRGRGRGRVGGAAPGPLLLAGVPRCASRGCPPVGPPVGVLSAPGRPDRPRPPTGVCIPEAWPCDWLPVDPGVHGENVGSPFRRPPPSVRFPAPGKCGCEPSCGSAALVPSFLAVGLPLPCLAFVLLKPVDL